MARLRNKNPDLPRVLAIASAGGHWVQLLRMRSAWGGCDVAYATSEPDYEDQLVSDSELPVTNPPSFYVFPEGTRWDKRRLIFQMMRILLLVLRERPDVVVSTGASAGYFAFRFAKALGSRTVWVDSVANVDELSLAGKKVCPYADLWLTQWSHLTHENTGIEKHLEYRGAVI